MVRSKMDGYIQSVSGQVIDDWLGYWAGKCLQGTPLQKQANVYSASLGKGCGIASFTWHANSQRY